MTEDNDEAHMTTNLAEAMNSMLKATSNLSITSLVQTTYYTLGSLFGKWNHDLTKMLSFGQVYTNNCNTSILEEVLKFITHNVMQFDREGFTLFHNESMRRKKKGRPNSIRFRIEMNNGEKEKRKYGICCLFICT